MSRGGQADIVTVKPTNNVYTVLALVTFLIVVGALLAVFLKAKDLFPNGGLFADK